MITNIQSLKDKAKNYAQKNNLTVQQVLQNYMFERFLERLANSKYNEKFIIKGGVLLSSIMGISVRTTMDIDANITGIKFDKTEIEKMIIEILQVKLDDKVQLILEKVEDIKEENEYGGYKFKIISKLGNLRIPFHIDISTGDIITPKAIEYKYKMILEDKYLDLWTYNLETILAEKLHTVLSRKLHNSRMKDFYDLYYFINFKWDEVNENILRQAIKSTFSKRESIEELKNIIEIMEQLLKDENLKILWKDYSTKHNYANNIESKEVISKIKQIENYVA